MKKIFTNFIKGFVIGISLLVPGLSGGTTAIILNVYTKILDSFSNLFSDFRKNCIFLGTIAVGGIFGVFTSTIPIQFLLSQYKSVFYLFIIGIIFGSIPIFTDGFKTKPIRNIILIILGLILTNITNNLKQFNSSSLTYIFICILMSIALILPGISITNILISFNYYEQFIGKIKSLNFFFIFKTFIIILISIIALTKALDYCYKKYPVSINMLILGMVLSSISQTSTEISLKLNPIIATLFVLSGLFCSLSLYFFKIRADNI